ncbi:MAG: hypothetical protein CO129_08990 [Ignavibacteriales bacterium CG_4_9_14_3_um_filter_34_10]|nr:MAG: hypothetical protein CO129_08990 [Ignavibacteriales bacterium CG_4_9_14_3_um_filter_34_10]
MIFNRLMILFFIINLNLFAQDDFFTPVSTIGGYGELHFNKIIPNKGSNSESLDFHRFVLLFSHSWTEKLSFKSEIEIEHNYVKSNQGELELEQAYIDYHHADWIGIQAGVLLPSVGLLNEIHEPPTFLSVERPDYSNKIIPTTWYGNGIALYGNYSGFDYKFVAMEGLNGDKISTSSGIRDARQKGYKSNAKNLLYNFRVNYINLTGLLIGTSYSINNAFSLTKKVKVNIAEIHSRYQNYGFYSSFELGKITYDHKNLKSSFGYYFELGYDVFRFVKAEGELIPFIRFSQFNTADKVSNLPDEERKYNNSQILLGAMYKPLPEIAVKFDYSLSKVELGNQKTKYLNLGIGYMF